MNRLNPDIFASIILPCRNVAGILEPFVDELHEALRKSFTYFEIVIIDDHSDDGTQTEVRKILKKRDNIRYIRLNRLYGEDIAVSAGLDTAIGDVVVVMDPKTDPTNDLANLIARCHLENGVFYGVSRGSGGFRPLRSALAKAFEWYCRRHLKIEIQSRSGIFRVFSRSAVNAFMQVKSRTRNLRIMMANVGVVTVPFAYTQIQRGNIPTSEKVTIFDDINRSFEIMVSTSRHPLRWLSRFGAIAAFINLLYCGYVLLIFLLKGHVAEGWVTLSFQSASMFFLLFVILSFLSEYVGKILVESTQGPLYLVEAEESSSVLVDSVQQLNIYPESWI